MNRIQEIIVRAFYSAILDLVSIRERFALKMRVEVL